MSDVNEQFLAHDMSWWKFLGAFGYGSVSFCSTAIAAFIALKTLSHSDTAAVQLSSATSEAFWKSCPFVTVWQPLTVTGK